MDQFLNGMRVVFPNCMNIKKACLRFEVGIKSMPKDTALPLKQKLIENWHVSMQQYYKRCIDKDESVWKELCDVPTLLL